MKEQKIQITHHAIVRMKERAGLNQKAAIRLAERAYGNGLTIEHAGGVLHQFLEHKEENNREGIQIRIYGELAYIFQMAEEIPVLLTAYQIPLKLRKMANKYQQRRKNMKTSAKI